MKPAGRQKGASSLASGGSDSNSSSLGRSGGGVIRGLLQSIRAGLSSESGSPRSSRSGLTDGVGTARVSQGQQAPSAHLDRLYTEADDSEVEIFRLGRLSGGGSDLVGSPVITRKQMMTGCRPSQTSSTSSTCSVGASQEEIANEILCTETTPTSIQVLSSGPIPNFEVAVTSAVAQLSPAPLSASAGLHAAADFQGISHGAVKAVLQPAGGLFATATESQTYAPPDDDSSETQNSQESDASPANLAKYRSLKTSFRRRLLKAALDSLAAPASTAQLPPCFPTVSRVSRGGSNDSDDAYAAAGLGFPSEDGCVAGADVCTFRDHDASNSPFATAGAPIQQENCRQENEQLDQDLLDHHQQQQQGKEQGQLQQQVRCRSASSHELSAVAVSQAVSRLQQRQQHERAAARFSRKSNYLPVGHTVCGNSHQYLPQESFKSHNQPDHHNVAAAALTIRVLSSTTSDGTGTGSAASNGDTAAGQAVQPQLPSPQLARPQRYAQAHMSPVRGLGPGPGQSRSAAGNFAFRCTPCAGSAHGPASVEAGGREELENKTNRGGGVGLEEWLSDVADISQASLLRGSWCEWEGRSSVSFTEGRVSAAERLQAMVSNAASLVGDDAASYLQQLLVPDVPSTASADLQYSAASTREPSAIALVYGSSSGPAVGGTAPPVGGLWGLLNGSNSPLACGGYGDGAYPSCAAAVARTTTDAGGPVYNGVHVRQMSAQHHARAGESTSDGSSRAGSRPSSGILHLQTPQPLLGAGQSFPGSATILNVRIGSSNSGRYCLTEPACSIIPHANKAAAQLVDDLRELLSAAAAAADLASSQPPQPHPPSRGGSFNTSTGALASGSRSPDSGTKEGGGDGGGSGVSGGHPHSHPHSHQQQREELVAALWRLVRAKDSDAVSYILAADPSSERNRAIAPVLQEMRSWVYLNMW